MLAGHDHAVAAWAAGVRSPGDRADSLGTTEAVYAISYGEPDVEIAHDAGASISPTLDGKGLAVVAANPSAGAVLEFTTARNRRLDDLDAAASELAMNRRDLLFHPDLRGRQAPLPDPDARIVLTTTDGLQAALPDDDAESLAVVARGLALQARWLHDSIDAIAGSASGPVTVIPGPLARSLAWQAARDTVLDRPVRECSVPETVATDRGRRGSSTSSATIPPSRRRFATRCAAWACRVTKSKPLDTGRHSFMSGTPAGCAASTSSLSTTCKPEVAGPFRM